MSAHTAVEDEIGPGQARCWCCGRIEPREQMVPLGNHPEVTLCVRCSYSIAQRAGEIEDKDRTDPIVVVKNGIRSLRHTVVQHGWHHNRFVGGALRRLGRWVP